MQLSEYHQNIIQYYKETEFAYKDSWDLENSLSIHYGYWDDGVKNFAGSLNRMNEVMMVTAMASSADKVLDAGCGVGGSSIFLAEKLGCRVTGISLSERQVEQAIANGKKKRVNELVDFKIMDYCKTDFPDQSFDIVWGCESICYAENKESFIKEAYRLLKPGGRLIIADGFVREFDNNKDPMIRNWLDGWQVNYLETIERFKQFMSATSFQNIKSWDITKETSRSSRRLYRFYWLASLYLFWRKISFSKPATEMQKKNIAACKYQYKGMKQGLWEYGLILGIKK